MFKQDRTAANPREPQKHGWIGRDGEPATLPFSDFLPPLLTNMVEDQFAYNRREEEGLTRWPIFEGAEARATQAPILGEHAKSAAVGWPTVRLPHFMRLLGRLGQP